MAVMERRTLLKSVEKAGYDGPKTKDGVRGWMDEQGFVLPDGVGTLDEIWGKKVTIHADGGEDIEVVDDSAPEPIEGEAIEDEEDEGEKAARVERVRQKARGLSRKDYNRATLGAPAIRGTATAEEKAYDRRAKRGETFWSGGEQARAFKTWLDAMRYQAKGREVPAEHRSILGKDLAQSLESLGGYSVPVEFRAELIENVTKQGAYRRAVGVTPMPTGALEVPKHLDDVTVAWTNEGETITAQNKPSGTRVGLYAQKATALVDMPNELLADSALPMADRFGASVARGFARAEDDAGINGVGTNLGQGFSDLVGANSTYDAALGTDWSDYTTSKIQAWKGLLNGSALADGTGAAILCTAEYFESVLRSQALGAGGATPDDLYGGTGRITGADALYDGVPVYFTDVLPRAYSGNQIAAYYGNFALAAKFGEVTGGMQIDVDTSAGFREDVTVFRAIERVAFANHDVNNDAKSSTSTGSYVVAVQD